MRSCRKNCLSPQQRSGAASIFTRAGASAPRYSGNTRSWEEAFMKRRQFLTALGAGAGVAAIAKPAIAQSSPELKWRLASSFPKSLDTLYTAGETVAKFVAEATDNRFQIENFAAGEIVPGLQNVDAVQNGTVEIAHTAAYSFIGKDPTSALMCSIPFGPNARQQNAWFYEGGGNQLVND